MNDDDALTTTGGSRQALDELARQCGVGHIGFHPSVDSTQDAARAIAELGAQEWSVVVADEQTAGRGQHGRSWRDLRARSLLLSIILRPTDAASMSLLPIRVALAISTALDTTQEPCRIMIKWPNDLILSDRKLGGILVEAQTRGSDLVAIVGIGINVLAAPPIDDDSSALPPIALDTIDPDITRLTVLRSILISLRRTPHLHSPLLEPSEITTFKSRDWLLGRRLSEPLPGIARGIDMSGHLVVEEDQGIVRHLLSGRVR